MSRIRLVPRMEFASMKLRVWNLCLSNTYQFEVTAPQNIDQEIFNYWDDRHSGATIVGGTLTISEARKTWETDQLRSRDESELQTTYR